MIELLLCAIGLLAITAIYQWQQARAWKDSAMHWSEATSAAQRKVGQLERDNEVQRQSIRNYGYRVINLEEQLDNANDEIKQLKKQLADTSVLSD